MKDLYPSINTYSLSKKKKKPTRRSLALKKQNRSNCSRLRRCSGHRLSAVSIKTSTHPPSPGYVTFYSKRSPPSANAGPQDHPSPAAPPKRDAQEPALSLGRRLPNAERGAPRRSGPRAPPWRYDRRLPPPGAAERAAAARGLTRLLGILDLHGAAAAAAAARFAGRLGRAGRGAALGVGLRPLA